MEVSDPETELVRRNCPVAGIRTLHFELDSRSMDYEKRPRKSLVEDCGAAASYSRSGSGANTDQCSPQLDSVIEEVRLNSCVVASLDRKRLGADSWGGAGSRSEAFSIRRLGGSRWRLRRTRCAMGFECQLAAKSRVGQAPANGKGRVAIGDSVARACKRVRGNLRGSPSPWGRHTNASMCRSTSQERSSEARATTNRSECMWIIPQR
jgi:hypothetical protein